MNSELLAQYGEACINLEIWQNKTIELKRKIADEMNRPKVEDVRE